MSIFTVVIIIWAIYKVVVSVTKKTGSQQTLGSWREQLKQVLENGPNQAGYLKKPEPEDLMEPIEGHIQTEGTQGIEGTSDYVGLLGLEAYKPVEETPSVPSSLSGVRDVSLTERELVQGVMWSVILGKPRAMHSFRGPRT